MHARPRRLPAALRSPLNLRTNEIMNVHRRMRARGRDGYLISCRGRELPRASVNRSILATPETKSGVYNTVLGLSSKQSSPIFVAVVSYVKACALCRRINRYCTRIEQPTAHV